MRTPPVHKNVDMSEMRIHERGLDVEKNSWSAAAAVALRRDERAFRCRGVRSSVVHACTKSMEVPVVFSKIRMKELKREGRRRSEKAVKA